MKISAINTLSATKLQFGKMNSSKNVSFNGLFQTEKSSSDEPKFDKEVLTRAEELKNQCMKTAKNDAVKLRNEGYEVLEKAREYFDYCQSVIKNKSKNIEQVEDNYNKIYTWTDKNNNQIRVTDKNNSKGYAESLIEVTHPDGKRDVILDNEYGFKVYRGYKGSFKDGYEAEKVYKYEIPIGKTKENLVLCTLSENVKKSKKLKSADRSFSWDINSPDNVKYITEGIKFVNNNYMYRWPSFVVTIDKRYVLDEKTLTLNAALENILQDPTKDHRISIDYSYDSEGKLIDYSNNTNKIK